METTKIEMLREESLKSFDELNKMVLDIEYLTSRPQFHLEEERDTLINEIDT